MRNIFIKGMILILVLIQLSCNSRNNHSKIKSNIKKEIKATIDSCISVNTVKGFFSWYKTNFDKINHIHFIKMEPNEPYKVEFNKAEIYFTFLRQSGLFSDLFLKNLKKYFESCEKKLLEIKQTDGPATGFEADLFLYCQDYNILFNNINNLNYKIIQKKTSSTKVEMTYQDEYDSSIYN